MTTSILAPTARQKLESSRLRPTQLELLGDDVDLEKFYVALGVQALNLEEAVLDVTVGRTIEGASTITATIQDQDRLLLRSGRLASKQDIEIDGLFFRLVQARKAGSVITTSFEDREIAILRTYDKPIKQALSTSRAKLTRAQFIVRMLREVKELPPIPCVIPELNVVQPIGKLAQAAADAGSRLHNRSLGIPKANDLTVGGPGNLMTEEQRRNANIILDVGAQQVTKRKILVLAMMCVIQESNIINLLPGAAQDGTDSVGCFQQRKSQGWPATRNIAVDAAEFYKRLIPWVERNPTTSYSHSINAIQNSRYPDAYAKHRTEAERIVTEYGVTEGASTDANSQWTPTNASGGDYEFYRGIPPTSAYQKKRGKVTWGKEDTWKCIQRLASEVNWRAFFVSGIFYFISDDDLFKSQPIATLSEDSEGVLAIDGDYDENKKVGTITLECLAHRWVAPPGSVVSFVEMGPWNGRWLVNDIQRSLFDPTTTITLKKPLPRFPEPSQGNLSKSGKQTATWTGAPAPVLPPGQRQYHTGTALIQPIPHGYNSKIIQGKHPTAGLTGVLGNSATDYLAADFGADAGAPVLAVENGSIVRLAGKTPKEGPWDPTLGIHGPFGWSIYLLGDSGAEYFITHLGTQEVAVNQQVIAGQRIGSVGDYASWGGANHAHVGIKSPSSGRPDIFDLMAAPQAVK